MRSLCRYFCLHLYLCLYWRVLAIHDRHPAADSSITTTLYFVSFYFFTVTFMLNLVLAIYIDSCVTGCSQIRCVWGTASNGVLLAVWCCVGTRRQKIRRRCMKNTGSSKRTWRQSHGTMRCLLARRRRRIHRATLGVDAAVCAVATARQRRCLVTRRSTTRSRAPAA